MTLALQAHFSGCIEGRGLVSPPNHSSAVLSNAYFLLEEKNGSNMGQSWSGTISGWPRNVILLESKPNALWAAVCYRALRGLAFVISIQSKEIIHTAQHQFWDRNRKVGCFNPHTLSQGQCLGFDQHGYIHHVAAFLFPQGKELCQDCTLQWPFWRLSGMEENIPLGFSSLPATSLQAEAPFSSVVFCDPLIKDNLGPQ